MSSRLGRDEDVGVEDWGARRPDRDEDRGSVMVDMVEMRAVERNYANCVTGDAYTESPSSQGCDQ